MNPSRLASSPRLALTAALAACSAVLLVACSTADPGAAGASEDTREITHQLGDVTIPTDPQNIVALDEYAAMDLLALGIEPQHVYLTLMSTTLGAALGETDAKLIDDPGFLTSPNIEELASLEPDVIVLAGTGPLVEAYDELSEVAPVVVLPYNVDWSEIVTDTGAFFGAEERATAVVDALSAKIASFDEESAATIGDTSVLLGYSGYLWTAGSDSPASRLFGELGIARVAPEAALTDADSEDGVVAVSPEQLSDHAAQTNIVLDGGYYDAASITALPTFTAGAPLLVDGDSWFGSHPFAIYWMLSDLEAFAAGDAVGTSADAAERWSEFASLIED
jgi:iron complex transport system substrate-binding protein